MSNKVVTILKCDNCQDGKVKLMVKGIKDGYEVEVKKCDSCGKYFGVKSVQYLKEIRSVALRLTSGPLCAGLD
jgi:protein-arginine kinase activator protein McsA